MSTPITVEMTEHVATVLLEYIGDIRLKDLRTVPDNQALDRFYRDLKREIEESK